MKNFKSKTNIQDKSSNLNIERSANESKGYKTRKDISYEVLNDVELKVISTQKRDNANVEEHKDEEWVHATSSKLLINECNLNNAIEIKRSANNCIDIASTFSNQKDFNVASAVLNKIDQVRFVDVLFKI